MHVKNLFCLKPKLLLNRERNLEGQCRMCVCRHRSMIRYQVMSIENPITGSFYSFYLEPVRMHLVNFSRLNIKPKSLSTETPIQRDPQYFNWSIVTASGSPYIVMRTHMARYVSFRGGLLRDCDWRWVDVQLRAQDSPPFPYRLF